LGGIGLEKEGNPEGTKTRTMVPVAGQVGSIAEGELGMKTLFKSGRFL
jgi:hypothetical protein